MRAQRSVLTLSVGLLAAGAFAVPAQAADNAQVSVLHGIPEATVDVYANGDLLLEDFEPGTLTDPQSLPAGSYDLKVVEPDAGADGEAIVEANDVDVPGGANVTVVAHLTEDGDPQLTPFVNDVSRVDSGKARLTVRHVAAAPAVDVRAGGDVVFSDLSNPDEDSAEVDAGTVEADVVLAGESDPVIGPADVELAEGTGVAVYAWGSAEDDNLELAVQTFSNLHSNPQGVPGGTGGQAAALDGALPAGLAAAALLGVAFSTRQLRRSRAVARR